jgi:hypothetical protein
MVTGAGAIAQTVSDQTPVTRCEGLPSSASGVPTRHRLKRLTPSMLSWSQESSSRSVNAKDSNQFPYRHFQWRRSCPTGPDAPSKPEATAVPVRRPCVALCSSGAIGAPRARMTSARPSGLGAEGRASLAEDERPAKRPSEGASREIACCLVNDKGNRPRGRLHAA